MRLSTLLWVTTAILLAYLLSGCPAGGRVEQVSTTGASEADPSKIKLDSDGLSVEQRNIQKRIARTTDPAGIMWIHLLSSDGKIVSRMTVQGKVTSSGKRLQPAAGKGYGGEYKSYLPQTKDGYYTEELIQPDGTYGHSDEYIYWFDPADRYHQLNTGAAGVTYLLTDYPIKLGTSTDAITGMYHLDETAAAHYSNRK